jgi:hypothetical protein
MAKHLSPGVLALLVAQVACTAEAPSASPPPIAPELAAVVRTIVEPPGTHCASGGTAVQAGLDRNRNGVLDDAEVTSSTYVCSPSSQVLLLRGEAEPPGANCPLGGVAVKAGLDANANGVLDEAEVDKVQYQCGAAAPTLPAVLTRTALEPAGARCPTGGRRIDAGLDRDANAVLGDAEVEQSSWVCGPGPVLTRTITGQVPDCVGSATLVSAGMDADGDGLLADAEVQSSFTLCSPTVYGFTVQTQADLDYLAAHVRLVIGDLRVTHSELTSLSLPLLAVSGSILIQDNLSLADAVVHPLALGGDLVLARNPVLASIYTDIGLGNHAPMAGSLTVEDAPLLKFFYMQSPRLGGAFTLRRTGIEFLALDSLLEVGGDLILEANDALTSAAARHIGLIGGDLVLRGNDAMVAPFDWSTFIGRPSPDHSGDTVIGGEIVVSDNARLVSLSYIPAISARGVRITGNPALEYVAFYYLVAITGDWIISDNATLTHFGSSSDPLQVVSGSIRIERNPKLVATPGLVGVREVGGQVLVADAPELDYLFMPCLVWAEQILVRDTGLRWLGPGPADAYAPTLTRLEYLQSLVLLRNPRLYDLRLPILDRVYELTVHESPLLPSCQAAALAQRTGASLVSLVGTDDDATCP